MRSVVKPTRTYNSQRRRQQAEENRARMLEAARSLFLEFGFGGTTMEAIAEAAGVAVETVYAAFGNKTSLFARVLNLAIAGDERQIPLMEQEWVAAVRRESDPRKRLRILVGVTSGVLSRVGPLHALVRANRDRDPGLEALKQEHDNMRHSVQLEFMKLIEDGLRPGLGLEDARDTYFTIGSPEVQHFLVSDRGWTVEHYREWLYSVLEPALLGPA